MLPRIGQGQLIMNTMESILRSISQQKGLKFKLKRLALHCRVPPKLSRDDTLSIINITLRAKISLCRKKKSTWAWCAVAIYSGLLSTRYIKRKKNIYISPPTLENASDVLNIDTISMQFDPFFLKIMVVRK
jgi:hypothetical protein